MFSDIELQFDNNDIGIINVVKRTKYIEIPSIPRYKSKLWILWYSCTNWNWLSLKLNKINIINEINILSIEAVKAIILQYFKFILELFSYDRLAIINIPIIGINNKDESNIFQRLDK